MKNIILLFFLMSYFSAHSQSSITINYQTRVNTNSVVTSKQRDYQLVIKDNKSIYYNTNDGEYLYFNGKNNEKIGKVTLVKIDDNHYQYVTQDLFYKNYQEDTLIFNELVGAKPVMVGEKLSELFVWKKQLDKDTIILSHKCYKATTTFRGRTYEAYFTPELATFGGPWKFDGLPGTILFIKSIDNYFILSAVSIKFNDYKKAIDKPYEGQKIVTWDAFRSALEENLKKTLAYMKSQSRDEDDGGSGSIKITDRIEDLQIKDLSFGE